jgi:hypothetical protein
MRGKGVCVKSVSEGEMDMRKKRRRVERYFNYEISMDSFIIFGDFK